MKRVLLGVPSHSGQVSAATMSSVITAASTTALDIQVQSVGLSLLARCFNTIFECAWFNGFDYLVLLHADIGVNPLPNTKGSWVDHLIGQLRREKLAALSAVVPIKSSDGTTSTALQLTKDNPYGLRRVCIRELAGLPQLITREALCEAWGVDKEVAGPLLINTGCLAMDLKAFDWTQWTGFEINDQIAFNTKGHAQLFTRPEDWHKSQWLYEMGWPYAATQVLRIMHMGSHCFTNAPGAWGEWTTDQVPVQCTPKEWRTK